MIQRRTFVAGMAAVMAAPPMRAEPQESRLRRIGVVSPTLQIYGTIDAFRQKLRELGHIEGQNVIVEQRFAEGRAERLTDFVTEMIRLKVDVLVVGSTIGALAAKRATNTLPIVFAGVPDPVGQGIVVSLARPGGNVTGISLAIGEGFAAKWIELLKQTVPSISIVAVLSNPTNPATATFVKEVRATARALNIALEMIEVKNEAEVDHALTAITAGRFEGIVVTADPLFWSSQSKLVQFAASKRLPDVHAYREFADAGGLMAYGPSVIDGYRRAAVYVDKILKGARPSDLPVEQSAKFDLVINVKAAKARGLTIPLSLLLRADQVIE